MHVFDGTFFEETSPHSFTAEVSELQHNGQLEGRSGLPKKFDMPGIGNGQVFYVTKVDRDPEDNTLRFVKYAQMLGCVTVTIFND